MRRFTPGLLLTLPLVVVGCGTGGSGGSAGVDGSGSSIGSGDGDGEENDADGSGSGSGTDSASGDGEGDGDGDGEGDGDGDGEEGPPGTKWDTLAIPDSAACGGEGNNNNGEPEFSYIWIADSNAGQVWKVNTKTLEKEGKYVVRPDSAGNPSRTSVSLSGHVAIANRYGGLTKVYATSDFCQESNGMPGIQTSVNGQVLGWGIEECVAWYTAMNYTSQRPAAWGLGVWNNKTCGYEDEVVWTSGTNGQTIDIVKLDGDDGTILDTVNLGNSVSPGYFGIYGGAVDGDGNFWGSQLSIGKLVRVDVDDMSFEVWPMATSGYGMTVDSEGYVWTCSSQTGRFDYQTKQWQVGAGGGLGCMEDGEGTLWTGGQSLIGVDTQTLQQVASIPVANYLRGVSIDFDGYVWGVSLNGFAYRCDPQNNQCDEVAGLGYPYTYSDMTGFALSAAGNPNG